MSTKYASNYAKSEQRSSKSQMNYCNDDKN